MRFLSILLIVLAFVMQLGAHPVQPGSGTLAPAKDGVAGECEFVLLFDVVPYVLGKKPADCDDAETYAWIERGLNQRAAMEADWSSAAERLRREIRFVDAQGRPLALLSFQFPDLEDLDRLYNLDSRGMPYMLRVAVRLTLPSGPAPSVQVQLPECLGDWIIHFQENGAQVSLPVYAGSVSPALDFPGTPGLAPAVEPQESSPAAPPATAVPSGFWRTCAGFVTYGIEHIWRWGDGALPKGLDHMAFILGICLLAPFWRQMLINVTAFTLAHSISFTLCLYGVVAFPGKLVEVLVALTLVVVGLEILLRVESRRARVGTAFGFGLIHGLAFAGDLASRGLEAGEFPAIILGFNGGVEIGHLFLALPATLLFVKFRDQAWFFKRCALPLAGLILIFGLWACGERISG